MGDEPESIRGLFTRLADDAGELVRSEVELYRAAALHRLALSRQALVLITIALLIALASLCCLFVMLAIGLSPWLGSIGAGFAVTLTALLSAGLIAKIGFNQLGKATAEDVTEEQP